MEQELRCSLCQNIFQIPVLLPCFHSLCFSCAEKSIKIIPHNVLPDENDQSKSSAGKLSSSSSMVGFMELSHGGMEARRFSTASTLVGIAPPVRRSSLKPSGSTVTLSHDDELDNFSDKVSIISETDSGVVCNTGSYRSSNYARTPSLNSLCLRGVNSGPVHSLQCPTCKRIASLDDRGVNGLPRNRALETIISRYSVNTEDQKFECQLCEEDARHPASFMCEQCEVFYCNKCGDRCHPRRGPLAKHRLLTPAEGAQFLKTKCSISDLCCRDHADEQLGMYCVTCHAAVCRLCVHGGRHTNHNVQAAGSTCKSHKAELSQLLQRLSEKAKQGKDFLQKLRIMQQNVLQENCLDFEALLVAQCDALMQTLVARKQELLERVNSVKKQKEAIFSEQILQSNAHMQRTTAFLQFCIEMLKEPDPVAFLQVSTDLMKRVSLAEQNFTQEMPFEWKVSPHFDLVLDTAPVLESLKSLELYEKKAPSVPNIVPVECRVDQNSVTISWKPSPESTNVDGYCLELADGVDSDFKEVFRGEEMVCTVDGLHFNTQYRARVKAFNRAGDSPYSPCIWLHTAEVAWFSFDPCNSHTDIQLLNNNLTLGTLSPDDRVALGTVGFSKGIHYWEIVLDSYENSKDPAFGVARFDVAKDQMLGKDSKGWAIYIDDNRSWYMHKGEHRGRLEGGIRPGAIIGVLLDLDKRTLSFYVDRKLHGSGMAFNNLHGLFYPAVSINRHTRLTLVAGLDPPCESYSDGD